ncbi:type III secretion inner membrane ring lipoprotein SctJ [Bradyrhizobium sp. CB3481]|uniref:type III secretion system inner membrane ring lipoprotein SctJ n=1 Tax=Bradyrhizobium sp. CB3481 TaxID=3039158 RepID=UPI0024B20A98|nr:type III secretion inner membrane ring lipoprotein SctJ [Bradyrhizobium sp. CB3481]WFU14891.1 type III secretion inner membrane ring lipoprotein SctJ [Bradyrhizobium sp. CB3481]
MLLVLFTTVGCASRIELYSNRSEREANEMLALLMRSCVAAERTTNNSGGASLMVSEKDVPRAMDVLASAGLPRDRVSDLGDLFKQEGMISSPTGELVRFIVGTSQELSRTLESIDGVVAARVHVRWNKPDKGYDGMPPVVSAAAVLVRHNAAAGIDQIVPKIKNLVASTFRNLVYDQVEVMLVEAPQNTELRRLDAGTRASECSDPSNLLIGLIGGIGSVICSAVLAYFLWRKRVGRATTIARS